MPLYQMLLRTGDRWEPVRLLTAPDAGQAIDLAEAVRQTLAATDPRFAGCAVCVEEVEPKPDGGNGNGSEDRQSFKNGCGG